MPGEFTEEFIRTYYDPDYSAMAANRPPRSTYNPDKDDPDYQRWKEASDELSFTPADAKAEWDLLNTKGFVPPPDNELVFVSSSANVPTHEEAMFFQDIDKGRKKSLFIVGDIKDIDPKPVTDRISQRLAAAQDIAHQFQYHRKTGVEALPVKSGSVDIIWDRKGCLWHMAWEYELEMFENSKQLDKGKNLLWGRKSKSWKKLMQTFQLYRRWLKPDGCIVIDNHPSKDAFEVFQYSLEESTAKIIEKVRDVGDFFWRDLVEKQWFNPADIGEGKLAVRVLKKNPLKKPESPLSTR